MFRIQRMRSVGTRNRTVGIAGYSTTPIAPVLYGASFLITVDPQYCTSDAGHTTPCTNGSVINSWFEQISKTWVTWQSLSGNSSPTFNVSGAKYSCDFSSKGGYVFSNGYNQGDMTIVQRFTPQAFIGCSWGNASNFGVYESYRATTTGSIQRYSTGPTASLTNGVDTTLTYTGTGILTGSVEKMRSGGGAWNTVNDARPTYVGAPTGIYLMCGAVHLQATAFKGMAVFPSVLTDQKITAVEAYFNSL